MTAMPPHDLDAEAAVLASCILARDAYFAVSDVLSEEHFYSDAHRHIYRAVTHLATRGTAIDIITVTTRLRDLDRLEQVGGSPYLAKLVNATPAVANVAAHARVVADLWRKRSAIEVLRRRLVELQSVQDGVPTDALEEWLGDTCSELASIAKSGETRESLEHVETLAPRFVDSFASGETQADAETRPTSGLVALDRHIGGLRRGSKYIVAARPGVGKTGFACGAALATAAGGAGVIIFSLEMPHAGIIERLIAQNGALDLTNNSKGRSAQQDLARSASEVAQLPIIIDDSGSHTVQSMRAATRSGITALRAKRPGTNLGLIIIDYVQLLTPSGAKRNQSREQEIAEISAKTRQLAKEFDCAVLELSQLSRNCETRPDKRPLLSDLKDSGALEADAFGVFMLYRADAYRKPREFDGTAEILVRKLRSGGTTGTCRAAFHGPSASFIDDFDEEDS